MISSTAFHRMRGRKGGQNSMLALVTLNELVPARHPVRTVKTLADEWSLLLGADSKVKLNCVLVGGGRLCSGDVLEPGVRLVFRS